MGEMTSMVLQQLFFYIAIKKEIVLDEQLKDERFNDDKFLVMLEAMYESNENLAQKLQDYDYCNYQGVD
jgi:hypothetical protein